MYCPNCEFEIKQEVTECPICGGELTLHPEEATASQTAGSETGDTPLDLSISNLILDAKHELDALDRMPGPAISNSEPEPETLNLEALLSQDTDETMFEFPDTPPEPAKADVSPAASKPPDFLSLPEDDLFRNDAGTPSPEVDAPVGTYVFSAEPDVPEQPFLLDDSLFIDETAPQPEPRESAPFIDEAAGQKLASALGEMAVPTRKTETGPDLLFGRQGDEPENDRIDGMTESQQQSDAVHQGLVLTIDNEKSEFSLDGFADTPEAVGARSKFRLIALALMGVVIIAGAYVLADYFLQQPEPPAQIAKPAVRKKAKQPAQVPETVLPAPEILTEQPAPASAPGVAAKAAPSEETSSENVVQQAPVRPPAEPQPARSTPERIRTQTAAGRPEPQQKTELAAVPPDSAPAIPPAADKKPAPKPGVFSVHVFSFKTQQAAQNEIDLLNKRGFSAYLETVDLGAKGIWHRVKVGPYGSRSGAEQARLDIKKKYPGIEPMLHRWR
ncbi:MAG: hypothetical protein FJ119_13250 [Deltaproteobacteria bacterium]|nr:hypothetical protein [Deltaproteobacteria bacterium]